jgi:rhomboid protease GluP
MTSVDEIAAPSPLEVGSVGAVNDSVPVNRPAHPDELESAEPAPAIIGPLYDRRQAREWALVLQSQNIPFSLMPGAPDISAFGQAGGWVLTVAHQQYQRAIEVIDLYEEENADWPPVLVKDTPRHPSSAAVPLALFGVVMFFLYVTGPAATRSWWFAAGRTDALQLLREPWRMITALTLHADGQHVLGNAISGSVFGSMVSRRLGPGGALLAIVVTGALGNVGNALYHLPAQHRSIGASTAVFAAVGLLAGMQTVVDWGRHEERRFGYIDMLAPVIGGLALLGSLGAGRHTDLGAHGFGFLAGALGGLAIAAFLRQTRRLDEGKPSNLVQIATGVAAAALVAGAWLAARFL